MHKVLIRGGGDLASGVARRLHLAGYFVVISELADPRCVRRRVSYAAAIHDGVVSVEGVRGIFLDEIPDSANDQITVIVDPNADSIGRWQPETVVDARMLKRTPDDTSNDQAELVVGLGPGFAGGSNCDVVVETMRGKNLGRVISEGSAQADTGVPDTVAGFGMQRVLRAPQSGKLTAEVEIGELVANGQQIAVVEDEIITAPFDGVLRGLIRPDSYVNRNEKIGDVYPGTDKSICFRVSDKANGVAGAVLEAINAKTHGRKQ